MKFTKILPILLPLAALVLSGCGSDTESGEVADSENILYVYNWDEYIADGVIEMFEEETGYTVVYDVFETNEGLYAKLASGDISYDVICPSDYMIAKMIANDMLEPIDYSKIPNLKYIGEDYIESSKAFDPDFAYSVPYTWGTVGILYNTTMVDEEVDSWSILFDEKYRHNIVMLDSVRDSYAVALKYLGYSLNTLDEEELAEATELLIKQKPIVQAYEVDYARERMINNSAAMAVIYSGEALYSQDYNEDLEYVVPKEGSNIWIDGWVIPKNAENKEAAHAWIDFMCRPDIAKMNLEYITYSTPNTEVYDMLDDEDLKSSTTLFPDSDITDRCEAFSYLGEEGDKYYNNLWEDVKAAAN